MLGLPALPVQTATHGGGNGTTGPATRRITNVGAAVNATDAVNKAQLDSVAATADAVGQHFDASGSGVANASGTDALAAGSG
ncbi:hypothetical protein B8W90_12495, partial [Staphylococcus hominis]